MKKITMLIVFFLAFVTKSHAQFPEGFEGATFPPTGWATFIGANGAGTESNWIQITDFPHTGLASAYVEYEDSGSDNEDWLVTPQFTVSASASALQFSQLQSYEDDYGTSYTIRVSTTTQTDPTAFTIVSSQTETDFGFMDYTDKQVDLSPYIGQSIYVAFVMTNNNGDDWLIDDVDMVSLVAVPGCVTAPSPADLAIDVPYGEITLSWTAPADASATSYDLYAGNSAAELELLGNYTETNTGTDLTIEAYNATVFWKVVAKNAGGDAVGCATWSFTTESAQGFCLNGYQYPDDTYVPVTCDGVTVNEIVDNAYAGEYAVVTVTNGQPYTFLSSVGTDFITISNAAGDTSLASGPTPLTWTSDVAGDVRFFIHADNQCATEAADRVRSIICGSASADFPDFVNLQSPATLTVMQGDSGTVYGQVYVAGVTDPAGQGAGITAWAGVNADNTDPSTWAESSWVPATYNAAATGTGNNDEYQAAIGANQDPGTYYYATRFRLNTGLFAYGGLGNFWNATSAMSGVLTVTAAPAPANDECAGAIALTPGGNFALGALTTTNVSATDDSGAASCQASSGENVWYSVVVPASGSITIETGEVAGSNFNDSVISVFSGTCGTLTEIDCNDDNDDGLFSTLELTGRTSGELLYISVWRYTGIFADGDSGAFQISAFDPSLLANPQFSQNDFRMYPNPVKDVLNLSYSKEINTIAVYNMLGQQVYTGSLNAKSGKVNLSGLSSGSYIVKLTSGQEVQTLKILKQ